MLWCSPLVSYSPVLCNMFLVLFFFKSCETFFFFFMDFVYVVGMIWGWCKNTKWKHALLFVICSIIFHNNLLPPQLFNFPMMHNVPPHWFYNFLMQQLEWCLCSWHWGAWEEPCEKIMHGWMLPDAPSSFFSPQCVEIRLCFLSPGAVVVTAGGSWCNSSMLGFTAVLTHVHFTEVWILSNEILSFLCFVFMLWGCLFWSKYMFKWCMYWVFESGISLCQLGVLSQLSIFNHWSHFKPGSVHGLSLVISVWCRCVGVCESVPAWWMRLDAF